MLGACWDQYQLNSTTDDVYILKLTALHYYSLANTGRRDATETSVTHLNFIRPSQDSQKNLLNQIPWGVFTSQGSHTDKIQSIELCPHQSEESQRDETISTTVFSPITLLTTSLTVLLLSLGRHIDTSDTVLITYCLTYCLSFHRLPFWLRHFSFLRCTSLHYILTPADSKPYSQN